MCHCVVKFNRKLVEKKNWPRLAKFLNKLYNRDCALIILYYCSATQMTSQVLQPKLVNKRYRGRHTFISLNCSRAKSFFSIPGHRHLHVVLHRFRLLKPHRVRLRQRHDGRHLGRRAEGQDRPPEEHHRVGQLEHALRLSAAEARPDTAPTAAATKLAEQDGEAMCYKKTLSTILPSTGQNKRFGNILLYETVYSPNCQPLWESQMSHRVECLHSFYFAQ